MKKLILLFVVVVSSLNIYGQFINYEPFIPEVPTSAIRNLDNLDKMNKSLLNYIIDLQSKILDMKLQTNDSGILSILNSYYRRLEGYKSFGPVLFQNEATIKEIPLKLKAELMNYNPKTQETTFSTNPDPIPDALGFSSSSYVESEWNSNLGKYETKTEHNTISLFLLTRNAIYFKKGSNDWLINKYEHVSTDEESVIFRDERNQMIIFYPKKNVLCYCFELIGNNYKYMTSYMQLEKVDPNVFLSK